MKPTGFDPKRSESQQGRRAFLRGAGGVAVALPFSIDRRASAAVPRPRERLVTFYYGNGLPVEIAAEGLTGALAPIAPHAGKMAMIRGIDVLAEGPFGNGHVKGSAAFACGMDYHTKKSKGGPSLDWVARESLGGNTPLATLSTGIYGADDAHERMRIVHSWRGVEQPNEPISDTLDLFHHLFGGAELFRGDAQADRRARQRRSILDTVTAEYHRLAGERGGLGASSRQVLTAHLEHVRDLERRAVDLERDGARACERPGAPEAQDALSRRTLEHWAEMWPVMVDLYVLALRCDLVRFGNLMVTSGGDRFPFAGPEGKLNNVHSDGYHRWPRQNPAITTAVVRWQMERLGAFLDRMDDPNWRDTDGGTLLDNTTLVIGTELGDPAPHSRKAMTFFVAGGRGRFRAGVHDLKGRSDVELYTTILRGMGVRTPFGDQKHFDDELPITT